MRTPSIASVQYAPADPPDNPAALQGFLRSELLRIGAAIQALAAGKLDPTHVAPEKPRDGMIRLADGTDWNPGAGQGVYCYYASTWNKLG